VYSIPNWILPFIGGILIDKIIGKRKGIILFTFIIAVGQFFFALATNVVKKN
jgi:dipeptide/tripeptide permease